MSLNRAWMYKRFLSNGALDPEFNVGLERFIAFAASKPQFMDGEKIKCPCKVCDNIPFQDQETVRTHLRKKGFVLRYYPWTFQGEIITDPMNEHLQNQMDDRETHRYRDMVVEAAGPIFNYEDIEEAPNPQAQHLYDMLKAADMELWPGCKTHSQLSVVARLLHLKSEHHLSERCFDHVCDLMKEIVPEDNLVPDNFYQTKKLLRGMGLPVQKIDCCIRNCMIYWREDSDLLVCKFCGHPRYKSSSCDREKEKVSFSKMYYFPLTPRLHRLYASNNTASHMRWHASSVVDGMMRHPADSPAWKQLNQKYPVFTEEVRNVRLGLSTDGFQPFGQSGQQYSSWLVILTPYNLPPGMCMKEQYMFLTILVPGPKNPKEKIDVFL